MVLCFPVLLLCISVFLYSSAQTWDSFSVVFSNICPGSQLLTCGREIFISFSHLVEPVLCWDGVPTRVCVSKCWRVKVDYWNRTWCICIDLFDIDILNKGAKSVCLAQLFILRAFILRVYLMVTCVSWSLHIWMITFHESVFMHWKCLNRQSDSVDVCTGVVWYLSYIHIYALGVVYYLSL